MSHLGKLQRKARIQRWKYVVVTFMLSLAGIAVTLVNSQESITQVSLLSENSTPPVLVTPETTPTPSPVDYFEVITTLDQLRQRAFTTRDLDALLIVSAENSPQLRQDQEILRKIIDEKLPVEFVSVTLISVKKISDITPDQVLLEVKDVTNGRKRIWEVQLRLHSDGSWRYQEVSSVPLSGQT